MTGSRPEEPVAQLCDPAPFSGTARQSPLRPTDLTVWFVGISFKCSPRVQHILLLLFVLVPRWFCSHLRISISLSIFLSLSLPDDAVTFCFVEFRALSLSLATSLCSFSANANQLLILKIMNNLHRLLSRSTKCHSPCSSIPV